ncbi:MAG: response regulator [Rhodoferax sp.]|nr:response regulator [Rhodoferax sp.]
MQDQQANPGNAVHDRLAQVRLNLVERMWWTLAGLAAFVLPLMLWRLYTKHLDPDAGGPKNNLIFAGVCICMLTLFPLRRRIPLAIRAAVPVALLSISGLISLFTFGAASTLFAWLVQSNFLVSTLYTVRAAALATVATAVIALLVGLGFMTGFFQITIDLNEYMLLPTTWVIFVLGSTVVPTLILYAISQYQKTIVGLLHDVQTQRDELSVKSTAMLEMADRLSEALRDAEKATEAKTQFLAHMTHELRTPLSGVIGMLELANKRSHDQATNRLLGVARDNAESLLSVVNDALDLSKIEAGKLTLHEEVFHLQDFIARSLEIFALRAEQNGIAFKRSFDAGLNPVRIGDEARIRQVLSNLVGNAMKFTHQGTVGVEVHAANPAQADDARVQIVVHDTGIGIDPQVLPYLFEPYAQANPAVQQRFGGTGLGLLICKTLVETMGGEIEVQSQLGKGTRFTVTLPLQTGSAADLALASSMDSTSAPARNSHQLDVLVAEDIPTNQMIVMEMLQSLGHRVKLASNGQEALQSLSQEVYDVVLMDMRMPVLDGLATTALIRKGGDDAAPVLDPDIYISAVTANVMQHDRDATQAAGLQDFLAKPVRQHMLYAVLQRAIDYQLARGRQLLPVSALPVGSGDSQQLDALLGLSERTPSPAPLRVALHAVFREDVQRRRTQLADMAAQANWTEVREIAHALCGAALTMGMAPLASASGELETACQQGGDDHSHKQMLTENLLRLLQQTLEESA